MSFSKVRYLIKTYTDEDVIDYAIKHPIVFLNAAKLSLNKHHDFQELFGVAIDMKTQPKEPDHQKPYTSHRLDTKRAFLTETTRSNTIRRIFTKK